MSLPHGDRLGCQRCEAVDSLATRAGLVGDAEFDRVRVSGDRYGEIDFGRSATERRKDAVRLAAAQGWPQASASLGRRFAAASAFVACPDSRGLLPGMVAGDTGLGEELAGAIKTTDQPT